jgi:glycerophosphoryl diester phosphodiesterase
MNNSKSTIRRIAFDSLRRRGEKRRPYVEGHRGCCKERIENTISSFQKAIEYDLDSIELDIWLTKDKIPVVVHGAKDGNLTEYTNWKGFVNDVSYEELKKMQLTIHLNSDNIKHNDFNNEDKSNTTNTNNDNTLNESYHIHNIPSLEEVFILCKDKIFLNIEIKDFNISECLQKVLDLIHKYEMKNQIAISSFKHQYWEEIKKLNLEIEFGFLYDTSDEQEVQFVFDEARRNTTLNVWYKDVNPELVNKAHEFQMAVLCWFRKKDNESEEELRYVMGCGVDIVCTNVPDVAIKVRQEIFQ